MNYIHRLIKYLFGSDITVITEKEVLVEVLSPNAYARLVKQLEPPIITGSDSGESAAYRLGIQRALSVVRKDFSI